MASKEKIPAAVSICLELNGRKIAAVQSYKALFRRSVSAVYAFGQEKPVATLFGGETYTLELTRVCATDAAISDGIDFFALKDFDLVVTKPEGMVIYTGCQWVDLQENADLEGAVLEKVTISATGRIAA